MIEVKDDYFIKIDGNQRKYLHFDNIFSITLNPSCYQGKTYDEAEKENPDHFWSWMLNNKIMLKCIYSDITDELVYGGNPEEVSECYSDFEKIVEAHAKYHKK